jgi:hypothetical protein
VVCSVGRRLAQSLLKSWPSGVPIKGVIGESWLAREEGSNGRTVSRDWLTIWYWLFRTAPALYGA